MIFGAVPPAAPIRLDLGYECPDNCGSTLGYN